MGEPIVSVDDGKIRGVVGKNIYGETIYKFLGVPYGKTPIGDLRFKAPQPVEPWLGIKEATKDGDACYNRDIYHENNFQIQGGEDCLVLNVFSKQIQPCDEPKPVMVYIHGGGFVFGSNKSSIYGPEFLLTKDVVVVVINYRLGILGFISLDDESLDIPGNAGLKDQVLALQWVQKNIKHFGGDRNNVTIVGESAGASSVHFHILSPSSKGLFHKAILESGSALCPWALGSANNGRYVAEKLLEQKDLTDKEVYDVLKSMTGEEVFLLQEKIPEPLVFGVQRPIVPVVEKPNPTAFLTKNPFDYISKGHYNHVPMLMGYTSNEGLILEVLRQINPAIEDLYTPALAVPWFLELSEEQRNVVVQNLTQYYMQDVTDVARNKDMLLNDSIFIAEIAATIKNHVRTSKCPVYAYRFSVECGRNFIKVLKNVQNLKGTAHADELGFLWNIQVLPQPQLYTLEFNTILRCVQLWTSFAKCGNPTPTNELGVKLPATKKPNDVKLLDIGAELTVLDGLPEGDRVELWRDIFRMSPNTVNYL